MTNVLNVVKINKFFGKTQVLKDVSFKIKKGQILGFVGPNGAGKTTAIKIILGLQNMNSGDVYINEFNIKKDFEKAIARVGAIVENPDLYMYLTGRENLKIIANMYSNISEDRIEELIDLVHLRNRIDDKVSKYSLGMRQRLGIAAALIQKPNLLILDEPTNGLDPEGIKDLRDIMVNLANDKKISVLVSSHNLLELESFCTDICFINEGKIIEVENIKKLKEKDKPTYHIVLDNVKDIEKYLEKKDKVGDNYIRVIRNREEIPDLLNVLLDNGYKVYEVRCEVLSLEDAYLKEVGAFNE